MKTYLVGPSVLHLLGHTEASRPGERVSHDFSVDGPEGEHGPAREVALLAAGALTLAPSFPAAEPVAKEE